MAMCDSANVKIPSKIPSKIQSSTSQQTWNYHGKSEVQHLGNQKYMKMWS